MSRGLVESYPILNYFWYPLKFLTYLLFLTSEQGALASLYASTSPEVVEKGYQAKYIIPYGAVSDGVNPLSLDEDLAEKLWLFSEKVCKDAKK